MKRSREDPHEYLGGDLPLGSNGDEDSKSANKQLSKRERNEIRKQANKQWRMIDRKVGSGIDPNPRHSLYYKTQIPQLLNEHEWLKFHQALVNPLPVTFRIGSSCPTSIEKYCINKMDKEFKTLQGRFLELDGVPMHGKGIVHKVEWMPNNVFQICCDSTTLARESALVPLSSYLKREVSLGHVVRQELASMLPALFLDVKPHHCILDVCAAPGSKTEQLLYLLGSDSPGMVVANDADPKRIETLRKRYNRCGSPNLLIINSRAEELSKIISRKESRKFDRIIADVPCSGDGTIRKFPHIWRLFRPRVALELHSIQLQIAIATVNMLKAGGRMVYSTCSINPIEDEAVVSSLLQHFKGALKLVKSSLPGLVSRPGLTSWQVSEEVFTIGEPDQASRKASLERLPKILPSMYPPAEGLNLHLEYCHRILPHDQDLGGFFVAVLELHDDQGVAKIAVKGRCVPRVTKEESAMTMKRLGYNPAIISHEQDKITYTALDEAIQFSLNKGVNAGMFHLVQSTKSRHTRGAVSDEEESDASDDDKEDDPSEGNGIFGSQRNGWQKVQKSTHDSLLNDGSVDEDKYYVSLVSTSVYQALHTWAGPKMDAKQAGVELGSFGLATQKFFPHPDNARMLSKYSFSGSSGVSNISLGIDDFVALCKQGAVQATLSEEFASKILSKCASLNSFIVVVPTEQDTHAVETFAEAGKRRMSKAERKRIKSGHEAAPTVVTNTSLSSSFETYQINSWRGMVVVLGFGDQDNEIHYVSAQDMLASYAAVF